MKLQSQGVLCACALFLALTALQLGTALAQDSGSGEKKKQDAVRSLVRGYFCPTPQRRQGQNLLRFFGGVASKKRLGGVADGV